MYPVSLEELMRLDAGETCLPGHLFERRCATGLLIHESVRRISGQ